MMGGFQFPAPLPTGRLDVHSHLLPGIDDGCQSIDDSLLCVRTLIQAGYTGTICTPHIWVELFPLNTAEHVRGLTTYVQSQIDEAGLDYRLWPGGELRLFKGFVKWAESHEIPTLAGGKCVLVDFWEKKWPKWADQSFDWLLEHDYQPILAHPERLPMNEEVEEHLQRLADKGVWLQGNFKSFTGEEGFPADRAARRWLEQGRYTLLALDMHASDGLRSRLEGVQLFIEAYGVKVLDRFLIDAPRELIF